MNERWTQLLISQGAQFADGRVVAYDSAAPVPPGESVLCDLSHYGVLEVAGDDASAFMQGQFTNDVAALGLGQAQWNGWCSPKGRLLATFLLWREAAAFYLLMPRAIMPAIQKKLAMYVLRSKVKLADVSDTRQRLGVIGAVGAMAALPHSDFASVLTSVDSAQGRLIRLSAQRHVLIAATDTAVGVWMQWAQSIAKAGAARWDLAMIREGIIDINPETQDAFVPQMANFELIGGVSFTKGCYTGQEIVARTQYRGILKRRMARVSFVADAAPPPGTAVYSPAFGDQACGVIALAADAGGTMEALVVAQIDSITGNSLFLDAAHTQPMTVLDLPYATG